MNLSLKFIAFFKQLTGDRLIAIDQHFSVVIFFLKVNDQGHDVSVYKIALSKRLCINKPFALFGENRPNCIDYKFCHRRRWINRVDLNLLLKNEDYLPYKKNLSDFSLPARECIRFCFSFNGNMPIFNDFITFRTFSCHYSIEQSLFTFRKQ